MLSNRKSLVIAFSLMLVSLMVIAVGAQSPTMLESFNTAVNNLKTEGWGGINASEVYEDMIETAGFVIGEDLFILDVRTEAEWQDTGVIEGALLISMDELFTDEKIAELEAYYTDPTAELIVVCGSGWRSTIAMSMLRALGYETAKSLRNGMKAPGGWIDSGYPVVAP